MVGVSTSGHFKDTWGTIDIDEQYSTLSVKQSYCHRVLFERREDLLKFNKSLYIYFIQIFEKKEGICKKIFVSNSDTILFERRKGRGFIKI